LGADGMDDFRFNPMIEELIDEEELAFDPSPGGNGCDEVHGGIVPSEPGTRAG
jgi:hypothetical protein